MSNKDVLQEINKSIQDIVETMLKAIMQYLTQEREFERQLKHEMLLQVYRSVGKEIGNQLSKQLSEQMKEVKILTVELPEKSGKSVPSLHIVHDEKGKPYQLGKLNAKGKLELSSADDKGKSIQLDIDQLGFSPKVEGSLAATSVLVIKDGRRVIGAMGEATKQAREGKPFFRTCSDLLTKEIQHDLAQRRVADLARVSENVKQVEYEKVKLEKEINVLKGDLALMEKRAELGDISKKDLAEAKKELHSQFTELARTQEGYDRFLAQTNQQLSKKLQEHCPQLSDQGLQKLNFHEKASLAQTAFTHTDSLTIDQLRDGMKEKGNKEGLQALEKAEGKRREKDDDQELDRGNETIEELTITETNIDIDIKS